RDQLLPRSAKVDKNEVFGKRTMSLRLDAERFANVAMSTIGSDQIIGLQVVGPTGDTFLQRGRNHGVVVRKGDQVSAIPHIAPACRCRRSQDGFEPILRTVQIEWLRAELCQVWRLKLRDREFPLFG